MKNTRKTFGEAPDGWEVLEPSEVISVAFVFDSYKKDDLEIHWNKFKKKVSQQFPEIIFEDHFWSDEIVQYNMIGSVLIQKRYFTPTTNRIKLKDEDK